MLPMVIVPNGKMEPGPWSSEVFLTGSPEAAGTKQKEEKMRTAFAILLAIAGLFMTALSADFSTNLPSENVRAHNGKIIGNLSELMVGTTQPIPVIVLLNAPATTGAVNRLRGLAGTFPTRYVYNVIPGFAAMLTSDQIAALARDATVRRLEYDAEVHEHLYHASKSYGVDIARTDFLVDGDMDGDATAYTKDDVVITILDSGIDTLHMDLDGGKVIAWKDFVSDSIAPYDDRGHGTHCASIAAGTGDAPYPKQGVAPGAALVGVKVLDSSGSSPSSRVIAGIDWVVANKAIYNIRILSISFGSDGSSDGKDAVSLACNNAVDAGLVVCVSAGNKGPQKNTIGSPAAAAKPITVGAMSKLYTPGSYFLCDFSSRGPTKDRRVKPDICGPGLYIFAAKAGTRDQYAMMSGTSMSTPFVAGTAALMIDAKPDLTPAAIKSNLMSTVQDWGPSGVDIDYGAGRLQSHEAVKLAYYQAGHDTTGYPGPFDVPHVYRSGALGGKGKTDIWQVDWTRATYVSMSVTMIMPNWKTPTSPDFNLYLYDPTGTLVDSSFCPSNTRQDYFYHNNGPAGLWQIWVKSMAGSGDYFFDLSCDGAASITQIQNQFGPGPQSEPALVSQPAIELFPNPATAGRVTVQYALPRVEPMTVTLLDVSGRKMMDLRQGENDVRSLAPGVYFVREEGPRIRGVDSSGVLKIVVAP